MNYIIDICFFFFCPHTSITLLFFSLFTWKFRFFALSIRYTILLLKPGRLCDNISVIKKFPLTKKKKKTIDLLLLFEAADPFAFWRFVPNLRDPV